MTARCGNGALVLRGTTACAGFARGPVHLLDPAAQTGIADADAGRSPNFPASPEASRAGRPDGGESMLRAALAQASAELTELQRAAGDVGDAREILEFQLAMIEDETLAAPAFDAIAAGSAAAASWRTALDAQIAEYEDADDEYFRARASDLRDIRDRVLRQLLGAALSVVPAGSIVIAADLPPSRFLEIDWDGGGIALFEGSVSSHVATLARARGIPMIVQMTRGRLAANDDALLDAGNGMLVASPDAESAQAFAERRDAAAAATAHDTRFLALPARTAGGRHIRVLLNVATPGELDAVLPAHCDGIGLVRTEFVLRTPADLVDEERQYDLYREIVDWAQGRPVTFRTLDAGGDKPIEGYTLAAESNPFLGVRGVRLSLLYPDILTTQLRALARVAALGRVRVMIPMVTLPQELELVRALLRSSLQSLRDGGVLCAAPELGMMVEVPAAAFTLDLFAADFFSIGSNDLIAYVTACGRDSSRLAALGDPLQPAVLRLIANIVQQAHARSIDVSLCGDIASDERYLPALVHAGLRSISVAPAALARVKAAIAAIAEPAVG